MTAKTVVLLIQNVLTKKFIRFNSSTGQVELQTDKFSKDNFILNDIKGQTHQYMIQVFSSPSTVLRVSGDAQAHLSLRDGPSDVTVLPPDNDTGVMLYIEIEDGTKYYLRVNSFETNDCDPSLELVEQSFIDNNKESGDQFVLDELKFDLVGVPSAELH